MYNPSRYQAPSDEVIEEIVSQFPFATLLTPHAGGFDVSHVPLVLEKRKMEEGESWVLIGHLARANPHWKALGAAVSTAVFHGPHAYVTPLWYEHCDVPTWNYVVAHLAGRVRLLETEEGTVQALQALSAKTEGKHGWKFEIPGDLAAPGVLLKSIIGFELIVERREAKLKLSQNKSSRDFDGVLQGLATRKDEPSHLVREWMQRHSKPLG